MARVAGGMQSRHRRWVSSIKDEPEFISLKRLGGDYLASRVQAGFIKDGGKRQEPVLKSLRSFLKHDDARSVTEKDLL